MSFNWKRVLSMVMVIMLIVSLMPTNFAHAEENKTPVTYVAKVGDVECADAAAMVAALNSASGDVTVEIYGKVLTNGFGLNNSNITNLSFVGKTADAEICVDGVSYIDVRYTNYPIAYTGLTLSHTNAGQNIDGFLPQYFSTYNGGNVTYTNCAFPNGVTACGSAAGTTYTFTNCQFNNTTSGLYSLWVYGNSTNVVIKGGTFSGVRGIKMYSEGSNDFSTLSVSGATFSDTITEKHAIVLTKGESITLTANTFNNTTGMVQVDDDYAAMIEGKTVVIDNVTYTVDGTNKELVSAAPTPSGSINGGLVNIENTNRTFLTIESYITYANESIVVKVFDANGTLLATSALVDTNRVLLGNKNFGLSTFVGINCTDDWWTTKWEEGKLRADFVPAKATLYVDGVEMNTAPIQMRAAGTEAAVNWAEVPGVPAAGPVEVTTYEELLAALEKDNANVIMMNDITATATQSNGYGKTGIMLEAGDVLDGNGKTLTINGANGTWDSVIAMKGGEVKNLTIAGAFRGVFMPGANGDVVINNCVFKDVVYTFNSDAGSKDYTVTIKNTTLNGWTSFSAVHKAVVFESCTFGEGSGYAFCRPYQGTTFTSCKFETGYEFDTSKVEDYGHAFNGCTYNGAALSGDNNAMFYNGGSVLIDGVATNVDQPEGNDFTGYTRGDAIWGEVWGNASESFVIKVLDANGNVMGTTSLNNIGGIINGNVNVTWSLKLDAASNTDEYWTMEWTTAPTLDNQPAKVELWVDGVKVSGGNVVLHGPDQINKIYAIVADSNGKILGYHTTLAAAVAAAESGATILLKNGEYELPAFTGKELTFKGETKDGVIVNDAPDARAQGWNGSTIHFENLTAKGATANYHGLANGVVAVTYKNCNVNGLRFLYAKDVSFENCAFNANGVEHSFWTYGASNITVTNCTFTYTDRAVNCYSENGANHEVDIAFTGCTFTYAGTSATPEGAVEINSGSVKSIDLTMNGCTAPEKGAMWFNSQWDGKKGQNTVVAVDGVTVWKPLKGTGTAEDPILINDLADLILFRDTVDNVQSDRSNQFVGKYVKLTADIDLAGINWNPIGEKKDHGSFVGIFDGGNHTISNLYVEQAGEYLGLFAYVGSFSETEQAVIKNLTLKNVTVKSTNNSHYVGGVVGNATTTDFENVHVTGTVEISGRGYIGGIVGHGYSNFNNVSVKATNGTISSTFWCAGGVIGYLGEGSTIKNAVVEGLTIKSAAGGLGSIVGMASSDEGTQPCTGEDLSAKNVAIQTYTGAYGDGYAEYALGYLIGGDTSVMTGSNTVENVTFACSNGNTNPAVSDAVASVNGAVYFDLQSALNAAAAGTGNVNVEILRDVDLTNVDWNPVTVSGPGYPTVTVNGNEKTITGLNDMLFAGTWAGNSGLIINNLTIKDSVIVNDENDSLGNVGVGAFIGYPQASATITLNNCHLVNSTVKGGHWTGGLIGMAGGYNGNDGPVFMNLTITGCSVTGSTITGKGSAGGVIGHGSCAAWTNVVIENTTVSGNTITSTGSSANKAGAVMGTIGAAGQSTTVNGVTKTGGASVAATVSGNTVTSNGTTITTIYGRQGTSTGTLAITGGSYDAYPIEENVSYAYPAEGYKIVENNGIYSVVENTYKVSTKAELDAALATAQEGETILLIADIDYGTAQLAISKAITLDLGGNTLTTRNAFGGMSVKNNPTIKNGTIVHASNTSAIKVWNAAAFEDLVIDVQGKGDANKTIGGIVLQSGTTTHVGSIKNVTIKGDALTNGIETYNCGDATQNVIGSMENVTIDAKGTGMLISAPVGTATNCSISGDVNGIEIWIKGTYSASLDLVNSTVEGGVFAHDEFKSGVTNNGTLSLTVDAATTGVTTETVTLTINHAEESQIKGEVLETIIANAEAQINGTYYLTLAEAFAAAKDGDTVTILAGDYTTDIAVNKAITVVGETDAEGNNLVKINGGIDITADGATVKNLTASDPATSGYNSTLYINAKNVLVEGCVISDHNAVRYSKTTGKVTFKDSTITGSTYGIHFDGSAGGEIVIDNCVITGWTSFAASIKKVTMTDTTFKEGNYNYVRFYQEEILIDGCTFNEKMAVDVSDSVSATVTVTDSTLVNGNVEDLFEGADIVNSTITVDGVELTRAAKLGDTYYETIADAIKAANAGETVTILAGEYTTNLNVNKAITVVGEGEVKINGVLRITADGATVKNLNVEDGDTALKINAKDVLVEDCEITGGWSAMYQSYTSGTVTFKDSKITGKGAYAIHFDGSAGGNIVIDNCVITGWTSFARTIEKVTIRNTEFAKGNYNKLRFYQDAELTNVKFNPDMTIDFGKNDVKADFTGCSVTDGSSLLDVIYLPDIAQMGVEVTVDSTPVVVEAMIGDTAYLKLSDAFAAAKDGDEVKIYAAGTYKVPTGKNITITGAVEGVKFDMSKAVGVNASMTFNNVTFEYGNANYVGLQHAGTMVYNNCTINGQVFLYGTSETFNNCTFNQISSDAYNVWTYGAKNVAFNECTFNSAGKSVLIYSEQADLVNNVTVTKSTFNASAAVDGKAAIEMDSSLTSGINLTIDGATTATGFGTGNVSGNSLWNNKKGSNTDANNDITVVVDNVTVLAPVTFAAKIGNIGYTSLAEALAAAQAGDTVDLLGNSFTDAAGFSLKGFTLKNGSITFKKGARIGVHGDAVLDNVDLTFDMDGKSGYPNTAIYINGGSATSLTLKNGSDVLIKNPGYTAIFNDGSTAYALNIDNSTLMIEGKGSSTGINNANITLINGKLTTSNTGIAINGGSVNVDGNSVVTVDGTSSHGITNVVLTVAAGGKVDVDNSAYLGLNIKDGSSIADGASVTVDNCGTGGNYVGIPARIQGTVAGYDQILVDNQKIVAKGVSGNAFTSIDAAIKAANAGETVTILAGEYTTNLNVNKAITVVGETDAQGNNLVKLNGGIYIAADGVTVKNLTASNPSTSGYNMSLDIKGKNILVEGCVITDGNAMRFAEATGDVTLKDCDLTATDTWAIHFNGAEGGNVVVDNCEVNGWIAFGGALEKVTLKDSTFNQGDKWSGGNIYTNAVIDGCTFNAGFKLGIPTEDANITVTNSKMSDGSSVVDLFDKDDAVNNNITVDGEKITYVAKIGNTYYETLEEALANVADWTTIKLVADATLDYNAREAYGRATTTDIIIDGQGFTLTLNQKDSDWSSIGMANAEGKLTLKNMTIEKTGYGDTTGAWNTHAIIFSCNVEMNNVTVNNGIAVQNGATLNNVTINEANGYYGLWINGNGQSVTMNGGAINATNGGRGIKIADQYIDSPASVTLNVTDTKFNTAKKAAVLVSSTAGANVTASNVDIINVAADNVNFVWVDEDWAANYGNVEVTGATKAQEAVENFNIVVKDGDKIVCYFKTLDELFDNVSAYAKVSNVTVELMGDVVATKVVKTNSLKTYNFVTNVAGGVTMDLQYADNWNYFRKVNIGEGVTVKAKYLVFSTESTIAGTVDCYYPYISGGKVTVAETGVLKYEGGDALQVKGNGAVLTVNGTVIAPTINVWVGNAQLIVSGENAKIESNWIDIWDGAPTVKIEDGATIATKAIKVSRGGEITVTDATLTAETIEVGHNGNSAGVLTETGNSTINGEIKMTAIGSVVNSDGGLNVTTNIADHKVVYENGQYKVVPMVYVAQIGETKYESLAEAIKAAQAGDTITLLADITEDVTVDKSLTIDGANHKYTGNISVSGSSSAVTVKNVNFVDGKYYAITTNRIKSITVEDCTVTDYAWGFLYANMSTVNVAVKNVTVDGGEYGFHWVYGTNATLENVTMTNVTYGIMTQNYGAKTITLKDCAINATNGIYIWERNTTVSDTFVFEGVNEITGMTTSKQAVVKAATIDGTNLYGDLASIVAKAENGQTVKLLGNITVDGSKTVAENRFGYETLVYVNGKEMTIDFNGYTAEVTPNAPEANGGLKGILEAVIFVDNGGNLTLKDSVGNGGIKVNAGSDLYCLIYNAESTLTVENGVYYVEETIVSGSLIYADAPQKTTIKGGNFTLGNASEDTDSTKPWIFNVEGKNAEFIDVLGGTYNQDLLMNYGSQKDCEVHIPSTKTLKDNGDGTWTIVDAVAYVGNDEFNNGYATLAEAIAAADGKTVTMLKDVTLSETLKITKALTLDLNGKTITSTAKCAVEVSGGNADLAVEISNGKIVAAAGSASNSTSALSVYDGADVTLENVDLSGGYYGIKLAGYNSYPSDVNKNNLTSVVLNGGSVTAENAAIIGLGAYPNTQIDINGATVTSTDSIAIYHPSYGTLNITSGTITGTTAIYMKAGNLNISGGEFIANGPKADYEYTSSGAAATGDAIVIESCNYGGYPTPKASIIGGTFKSANNQAIACYNSDDAQAVTGFVSGGIFSSPVAEEYCAEGYVPVENADNTWTVVPLAESGIVAQNEVTGEYYKTVSEALAAAKSGDTVKLVQDAKDGYIIVPTGVTLDLGEFDLEANYVVGFNGSFLTATPNSGKLIVAKDNIVLSEQGYKNEKGQYVLPVWNPSQNCYVFSLFVVNTDRNIVSNRGLTITDEMIKFQFQHQATGAINQTLLKDGTSDNALAVIIRLEWSNENGSAYQDFVYNDAQVGKVTTGEWDYGFELHNYNDLKINLNTLKVTAMIVTDSGATAYGTTWTAENAR